MKQVGYPEIDTMDWFELHKALSAEAHLPYSVHVPLNYPASDGLVFCDCAMNAYYLPTPALNSGLRTDRAIRDLTHLNMVCFGFGEYPFVPDFRQVKLARRIGGLPIIRADFTAYNIVYLADYCLAPDGIMHIRMTVRNEDRNARKEVVWIHPQIPLESDVHDYHYVSFNWSARRWRSEPTYRLVEDGLYTAAGLVGRVTPGKFEMQWIEHQDVAEKPYWFASCATPYCPTQEQRISRVDYTVRMGIELQPNEETSFELAIRLDGKAAAADQLAVCYDAAEAETAELWRGLTSELPQIDLGDEEENNVIEAVRLCNLQLLLDDGEMLRPCQGGFSERYYVWVWEAMCSMLPMVRLGHFAMVRRVVEFFFSLQDGGCPPVGEFTSVKGAIGTSGPKWANSTGAALILASEYIRFSDDKPFARLFIPKMLAAARWITGELHETRKLTTKTRGIMPPCRSTDGDVGQSIFTDSWTLGGLKAFGELLTELNHPDAAEITAEARQYKADLDAVLDAHAEPDGFIPRAFGDLTNICQGFRFTTTMFDCIMAHVSSSLEDRMKKYLAWRERNSFEGVFCSPVSHGIYYIGNNELAVMKMYMELNKTKCAWAAGRAFRRFVVTPDVYMTQERFSTRDSGFTAWQPNASNNGRLLDMQMSRFFYQDILGRVILFGAFSPFELRHNPALKGVYTAFGAIDLAYANGRVTLTTEKPMPKGLTLLVCGKEMTLDAETTRFEAVVEEA